MFPEDPKDPELSEEAEELLTHWPLTDKSPEQWEDLALRIDARIKITEVGSTPDYLLEAPVLEEQELLRRSHPRMKRPSEGSLAALAKATQETSTDREREALARSLLSLAVKARSETQNTTEHSDTSADLAKLVNGGPAMQFLAARPPRHVRRVEGASEASRLEATTASSTASAASIASATSAASAATARSSRERGSMWFGIAFGLLGMAAAGVMYIASTRAPAPAAEATLVAPRPAAPAKAEPPAPAAKPATPAGDLLNVEEVPLADATPTPVASLPKDALPKAGAAKDALAKDALAKDALAKDALAKDALAKDALAKDGVAAARPAARAHVAPPAAAAAGPGADEPARVAPPPSGPSEPNMVMADSRGALPDHPSAGAVQAAVGTVMGAARACVAGQNGASRATLSFGSDGRVQSVTVTGPAQATSAEPCLQSALSGARVQPFARANYSVTLTVRPQ